VLGVPVESHALKGMDSLLSIAQMPAGVPVGTLSIGRSGAVNAALLAAAIVALVLVLVPFLVQQARTALYPALERPMAWLSLVGAEAGSGGIGQARLDEFGTAGDVLDMAREVLPVTKKTPVLAGVNGTDPFVLMPQFLAELKALEVKRITPSRFLLIVTTGDEVLDYRAAVARYRGCRQIVIEGGDHSLAGFADYLDDVLAHCDEARQPR